MVGYRFRPDIPLYEGAVAKTEDGGRSWTFVSVRSPVKKGEKWHLRDVVFVDSSHGVISADGGVFVTTDGGMTWSLAKVPDNTYESVRSSSSGRIWVTERDSDRVVSSKDRGDTWTSLDVPNPAGGWPISVIFLNNNRGLLANGGFFYNSSDGGKTWRPAKFDGLRFYSLHEIDGTVVAFADFNDKDTPVTSEDGGKTWHLPFSGQILHETTGQKNAAELCSDCFSRAQLQKCAKHKEWPAYPSMAKIARVQDTVTVEVEINSQGDVVSAKAVSGHPVLVASALEAAKHWTF